MYTGAAKIKATTPSIINDFIFAPYKNIIVRNINTIASVVPKSGCNNISIVIGIIGIKESIISPIPFIPSLNYLVITDASIIITATFTNSDGCMVNGPSFIHLCAPSVVFPANLTMKSNARLKQLNNKALFQLLLLNRVETLAMVKFSR